MGAQRLAALQAELAVGDVVNDGRAHGHGQVGVQRQAQAGLQRAAVIALIVRDQPPALHEPLPAVLIPGGTGFTERRVFGAHQYAIFKDAQVDQIAAGRKPRGVQIIDAAVQVEALQQALPIVGIHACVAAEQHGQRAALPDHRPVQIGLGGAEADALEAVQRQHAESEIAALGAGEVAAVHAAHLHIVLARQIIAQVQVIEGQRIAAATAALLLPVVGPVHADVSVAEHSQHAGAHRREAHVAAATTDVEHLLVQQGVLRGLVGAVVAVTHRACRRQPLACREEIQYAFVFIVDHPDAGRVIGGRQVAAATVRRHVIAGEVTIARQRGRQCRHECGLGLLTELQRGQHRLRIQQAHAVGRDEHRPDACRAPHQTDVELFGLAGHKVLESGGHRARARSGAGEHGSHGHGEAGTG